jgi:hypothetical protein
MDPDKATDRVAIESELGEFVALGPRFQGTPASDEAADFIRDRLAAIPIVATGHRFPLVGWSVDEGPALALVAPVGEELSSEAMLWSGGTDESGVEGNLEVVGTARVWAGGFRWRKLALTDSGRPVAFVCVRDGGEAIPQPVPSGSMPNVPHVVIGEADGRRIEAWLAGGERVRARLKLRVETGAPLVGRNIVGRVEGTDGARRSVLVCAHYDTFWNTPGAYDNASGVVALLQLLRRLAASPPSRGVEFAFFGGEEWHLAGSRAFVRDRDESGLDAVDFVLNIDGLGRGNFLEVSAGPEAFEWEVRQAIRAFRSPRRLRIESTFPPLISSDHSPFYQAGLPVAHLTFNDWPLLHRAEDLPTTGSVENIAHVVELVEQLVRTLPGRGTGREERGLI